MMKKRIFVYTVFVIFVSGCQQKSETSSKPENKKSETPTNRIDIPPTVRSNLGITFARVEVREVEQTIRVPGSFEFSPEARREFRTMVNGRIELEVEQYEIVETGQLLFTLDSPHWRELQQQLNESKLKVDQTRASASAMGPLLAAHERHHHELEEVVAIWQVRVEQLEASIESGVVTETDIANARGTMANARAELAEVLELEAELRLRQTQISNEITAHQERFELMLEHASLLLSLPVESLQEIDPDSPKQHPRWREIQKINVLAQADGIVESLSVTNGAWAEASSLVLTTVQTERLRFRAMGLQSDLPKLINDCKARIAPPRTPGLDVGESVDSKLIVGLDAHPDNRTISLIAKPAELHDWMRPGVSAFLEIVTARSEGSQLAIPRSAIVKDGINHVYFRRDPKNPNQVIRMEADMGVNDGRWVVINSGIMRNDEVVLDGAYELKLASSQNGLSQKGGHFHADGSFHGDH